MKKEDIPKIIFLTLVNDTEDNKIDNICNNGDTSSAMPPPQYTYYPNAK